MIAKMALAQLRANKTFTVWTAGLMTLLVAILTYLVVAGTTQASIGRDEAGIQGYDRENHAWVNIAVSGPESAMITQSADKVTAAIDTAIEAGARHRVLAVAESNVVLTPPAPSARYGFAEDSLYVRAVRGASGDMPTATTGVMPTQLGEVALAWNCAHGLGAGIGDTVTLYSVDMAPDGSLTSQGHELRVVGLTASTSLAGYELSIPDAYVAWEEATTPGGLLVYISVRPDPDRDAVQVSSYSTAFVHWDGVDPALQKFGPDGWEIPPSSFRLPQSSLAWFGAAVVLFVAMVVMAFAVGRSQASARTQWVATARAMGARRLVIAAATAVETLLLAVFAMVAGTALGIGVSAAQLALARQAAGAPFGPSAISLNWAIVPVVVAATTLVAIVVAAVPAFWASRVSPTAALKPVSDVTEAEISRRVSLRWTVAPFVVGVALVALGSSVPTAPMLAVGILGWITVAIGGFVVILEALRWALPAIGRRLAVRNNPGLMSAGDALASRPRQAVAPALLITVGVGFFTAFTLSTAHHSWNFGALAGDPDSPGVNESHLLLSTLLNPTMVTTFVIAALTLQLVAVAIFVSQRAATSHEATARRAMGLSRVDETRALWWQQWLPQAVGSATGLVGGGLAFLGYRLMSDLTDTNQQYLGDSYPPAGLTWGVGAGVAGAGALTMVVLAALFSWLSVRFRPAKSLNPS